MRRTHLYFFATCILTIATFSIIAVPSRTLAAGECDPHGVEQKDANGNPAPYTIFSGHFYAAPYDNGNTSFTFSNPGYPDSALSGAQPRDFATTSLSLLNDLHCSTNLDHISTEQIWLNVNGTRYELTNGSNVNGGNYSYDIFNMANIRAQATGLIPEAVPNVSIPCSAEAIRIVSGLSQHPDVYPNVCATLGDFAAHNSFNSYWLNFQLAWPFFTAGTHDQNMAQEDALLEQIASTGGFDVEAFDVPKFTMSHVTNCVTLKAPNTIPDPAHPGQRIEDPQNHNIVFLRTKSWKSTASEFLAAVEEMKGFIQSTDPYAKYPNSFSFSADLRKIDDGTASTLNSCDPHPSVFIRLTGDFSHPEDHWATFNGYDRHAGNEIVIAISNSDGHGTLDAQDLKPITLLHMGTALSNMSPEFVTNDVGGGAINCNRDPETNWVFQNKLYAAPKSPLTQGCVNNKDVDNLPWYRSAGSTIMNGRDPDRYSDVQCAIDMAGFLNGTYYGYGPYLAAYWIDSNGSSNPGCGPVFDIYGHPSQGPMNTVIDGIPDLRNPPVLPPPNPTPMHMTPGSQVSIRVDNSFNLAAVIGSWLGALHLK